MDGTPTADETWKWSELISKKLITQLPCKYFAFLVNTHFGCFEVVQFFANEGFLNTQTIMLTSQNKSLTSDGVNLVHGLSPFRS